MKGLPVEGLWVSPSGERLTVIEHLISIQQHPEFFGIQKSKVHKADILALRNIAEELIRSGWLRFRFFPSAYAFEVDSVRRRISTIEQILVESEAFEREEVVISQAIPKREFRGMVKDVYDRTIFGYQANPKRNSWRVT